MSRRVVPLHPPTPRGGATLLDALDSLDHDLTSSGRMRPEIGLAIAFVRALIDAGAANALGTSPSCAQVYGWREVRMALVELGRLVVPVEEDTDPADDPELAVLVEAIRSSARARVEPVEADDTDDE